MSKRPCWVEISAQALEDNYRLLADLAHAHPATTAVELLAIVKADAYGHGLALCAPAAVRAGANWLGVTSVEEGVAARALLGGKTNSPQILVIGGPFDGQGPAVISAGLTPVVWQLWQLDELESAARATPSDATTITVHLELDTGMSRQGVSLKDLDGVLERFHAVSSPLKLGGLMTHLYAADESDGVASQEQLIKLKQMVKRIVEKGLKPEWLSVGNSAAVLGSSVLPELAAIAARYGMKPMSRPGLALYGLAPGFEPDEPLAVTQIRSKLQRVLQWKTRVVTVRSIAADEIVGYNATFVASEPMNLALLAVGYGDGLNRKLSNRGAVLIGDRRCPIVGRISMDQTVVDVTEVPSTSVGDEVVLIGRQGEQIITTEDHAGWAETIPWEIFTSITARVDRKEV